MHETAIYLESNEAYLKLITLIKLKELAEFINFYVREHHVRRKIRQDTLNSGLSYQQKRFITSHFEKN